MAVIFEILYYAGHLYASKSDVILQWSEHKAIYLNLLNSYHFILDAYIDYKLTYEPSAQVS